MKQTITYLFLFIILFSTSAFVQSKTSVSGKVIDNGKPVEFANISILQSKDSTLVKTDVTDNNGNYDIDLTTGGSYLVRYTNVGFETKFSAVFTVKQGENYKLPDAKMIPISAELKTATVTAKKPMIEVKADKVIFNIENSINATGSNAMELLQKSPGLIVDNNDNISMKGKSGVRIYIDGKISMLDVKDLAAFLKSINSNDVEAIEMISNPSAKYDASGNAGIINIRLKKNKRFGTNGSVDLGYVQGITGKENGSVNLNYRDKKVNIFGNVGANIGSYENGMNLYRIQKDTIYDQHSTNTSNDKNINIKTGADFFVNSKNTIGVLATTNFNNSDFTSHSNTNIYYPTTDSFIKKLVAYNSIPGNRTNANFNTNYRYVDTNGREVNVDADYGLFRGTGRSLQPNYYYNDVNSLISSVINRNNTPTDIDIYTVKADAEQKMGKGKIGYGAKVSYVATANTFDFYNVLNGTDVKQLSLSNNFKYTENINAGYVNYQNPLSQSLSLQAGLRVENTSSTGELKREDGIVQADNTVKRNYTDLFPSGALTWTANKKNTLNLTYSRRIDRPTYQDLNPFENKLDELTYQKGNAFLLPQYTNTVELTHTFTDLINTTIGYSNVSDYATQVTDTIKNAGYVQQQNIGTQKIFSFNIGAPTPIRKWWNGYANIWYSYQTLEGQIGQNKLSLGLPIYGAYLQQTFTLKKDYSIEVSGSYNGPALWGGSWKTKPQGGMDLGIQKRLFNNNATLKLSVTDILYTYPWKATSDFGGSKIIGSGNWESQTIRISFSYRFGSNQISSARQRKTGLENEANRIKGGKG
ncbi:MAG: TonB-dependent receptor [Bacteroidota bacterium]